MDAPRFRHDDLVPDEDEVSGDAAETEEWTRFHALLEQIAELPHQEVPPGFDVLHEGDVDVDPTLGESAQENALLEYERLGDLFGDERECCRARRRLLARDPLSSLLEFGRERLASCPRCAAIVGIAAGIRAERVATGTATAAGRFLDLWRKKRPRDTHAKVIASAVLQANRALASGAVPWSPRAFFESATRTHGIDAKNVCQNHRGDWTGKYEYGGPDRVYEASAKGVHRRAKAAIEGSDQ